MEFLQMNGIVYISEIKRRGEIFFPLNFCFQYGKCRVFGWKSGFSGGMGLNYYNFRGK